MKSVKNHVLALISTNESIILFNVSDLCQSETRASFYPLNPALMEQNTTSQQRESMKDEALVERRRPSGLCVTFASFSLFAEKARDYLHKTGRFIVIGGIISPVHDSYGKPVSYRRRVCVCV